MEFTVPLSRAGIPHKTKDMIISIKDTQRSFKNHDGGFTYNVVYTEVSKLSPEKIKEKRSEEVYQF